MSFEKNQLYTSLGAKTFNRVLPQNYPQNNSKNLKQSLEEFHKGFDISHEQWGMSLCEDLKECLSYDDLNECLESLFKLEHLMAEVDEELEGQAPHLEEFYRHLSPSLLRVLWEVSHEKLDIEGQKERWLEALRVSLEEELYVWQEKMFHKNELVKKT
jgi:hypothetical protein